MLLNTHSAQNSPPAESDAAPSGAEFDSLL